MDVTGSLIPFVFVFVSIFPLVMQFSQGHSELQYPCFVRRQHIIHTLYTCSPAEERILGKLGHSTPLGYSMLCQLSLLDPRCTRFFFFHVISRIDQLSAPG
ncbi:hypothetical protein BJX99DRAFT_80692 [Aspergillus californicus]